MIRRCSWCQGLLGIRLRGRGVTHGICRPCVEGLGYTAARAEDILCRLVEAAGDAAVWLILIAGYLLGVGLLYAILAAPARGGETMEVVATAYSYRESSHRKWGDRNALGSSLKVRVQGLPQIAVDPSRIPLGSIVEVEGLGRRIATDTGGLIHGRRIDVHTQTVGEMHRWGKRTVEIEVIRRGWGSGTKTAQRETHRKAAAREVARRDAPEPRRERLYVMSWGEKARGRG
jgi:3D (Asp-Asp-Asp) domain-containing protein